MFEPTYHAALQRLKTFLPKAGREYAVGRNYDDLTHVSTLSPYIRHRILTEEEVLNATLRCHTPKSAEKFIQEVFWRTYWKGWLEQRPEVWKNYKADLRSALNRVQTESGLRKKWESACHGETGIDGFDHWAQQLTETGYMHNHARMWFASIWIYTLQLPWSLGADFFLRHLLDGDAASNTLSWRWVGGLQTIGKTYLARPDNIEKYTNGRFRPKGLASIAVPLDGTAHPPRGPLPHSDRLAVNGRVGMIVTEDDLSPNWLLQSISPAATAMVQTTSSRSPLKVSGHVNSFAKGALEACANRFQSRLGHVSHLSPDEIETWKADHALDHVVSAYMPVGPTKDMLSSIDINQVVRPFDTAAWPHATHGFFRFKEKIPKLIGQLKELGPVEDLPAELPL